MRTSALAQCAPGPARIRCCGHVLCSRGLSGPCRAGGTGREASDPPVRGPGTGSGPGVLAHPHPRPLGVASVPAIRPGRVSSAVSRRRPTGWPSGWPASPTKTGTRLFRRALRLPAGIVGPERPLAGRGEGVNTHSPLCRTKPSGRGVAPVTAIAARSAPDGRAARPQDTIAQADGRTSRRETPEGRFVKRPPASFSHRSAA